MTRLQIVVGSTREGRAARSRLTLRATAYLEGVSQSDYGAFILCREPIGCPRGGGQEASGA